MDEFMNLARQRIETIKLLKNNSIIIKRSSELLNQASLNLDKIIDMYEHPLKYIQNDQSNEIRELFENFNKCLELSGQGINVLTLYNDIQVANIEKFNMEDDSNE